MFDKQKVVTKASKRDIDCSEQHTWQDINIEQKVRIDRQTDKQTDKNIVWAGRNSLRPNYALTFKFNAQQKSHKI